MNGDFFSLDILRRILVLLDSLKDEELAVGATFLKPIVKELKKRVDKIDELIEHVT